MGETVQNGGNAVAGAMGAPKALHFQVNARSGSPVYRQIMDQIHYYVASNVLSPGSKLPSIRALAKSVAVNPSTIVKAYTELEHAGVIENKQGLGAFIADTRKTLTQEEIENTLRQSLREVWVQAGQLGAGAETVRRLLDEEGKKIRGGSEADETNTSL